MARITFFILSIALTALAFLLLFREYNPQWRTYQSAYLQSFDQKPAVGDSAVGFSRGVKQDWLPELDRADRCRTCHLGIDDQNAPHVQPLAVHPSMPEHPFTTFGCTVCHSGNGMATRLPDAHIGMLPSRLLESSCVKCHDADILALEAPTAAAGNAIIADLNCKGCHLFSGQKKKLFSGPDLAGIRLKVEPSWLNHWLKDPKHYLSHAKMANFLLSEQEVNDLAEYLLTFPSSELESKGFLGEDEAEEDYLSSLSDDAFFELAEQGKVLFGRMRCLSCHKLNKKGGVLGPDLGQIASKTKRRWLSAWLRAPSTYDTHTIMPTFTMSRLERVAVVEFLLFETAPSDEDLEEDDTERGALSVLGKAENGARLFVERGCFNCHYLPGVTGPSDFAPSLARLADKPLEKIEFGKTAIAHTLPEYVVAKLQAPRVFLDNLKMPYFALSLEEVGKVSVAVVGMTDVPDSYSQKGEIAANKKPAAEVGKIFDRYQCFSCHRINGYGGELAPDLSFEGSKVQNKWLRQFLLKPYAIRPFLEERMPRFNMTEEDAALLADYFTMVLRLADIDIEPVADGDAVMGKKLYVDNGCQKCHTIGESGGYYGPALDVTGKRLRSKWLSSRMRDSHAYEKWAREPLNNIAAADLRHIVQYLLTLGQEEGVDE